MHLESLPEEKTSQALIDDLYELAKGGPVGRAKSPAQNLHHFIKSLCRDVEKALSEQLENEAEAALDRASDPYPGRLYPEAEYN